MENTKLQEDKEKVNILPAYEELYPQNVHSN